MNSHNDNDEPIKELRRQLAEARQSKCPCATLKLINISAIQQKLDQAERQARGEIDAFEIHSDLTEPPQMEELPTLDPQHWHAAPDSDTPCPYCGKPLRTSTAKQCRHCLRDWHDPDNVEMLEGAFPRDGRVM